MNIPLKPNNIPKEPGLYIGSNGATGHDPVVSKVVCLTPWDPNEPRCKLYLQVNAYSHHPLEKVDPTTRWSDRLEFPETDDTEGEILRRNLLTSENALEEPRGLLHTRFNLEAISAAAKRAGLGKLAHAATRAADVIKEYVDQRRIG